MSKRDWTIAGVTAVLVLLLVAGTYVLIRSGALGALTQAAAQLPGIQYLSRQMDAEQAASNPQAAEWIEVGAELEERGEYREAIRAYEKAIELAPKESKAYLGLSSAYESLEEWEQALAQASRAAEIAPDDAQVLRNLGRLQCLSGDGTACAETLERAVRLEPDNAQGHYLLAIAYHEAGHAIAAWALTEDKIARVTIIRYSGGPSGGASLGHVSPVPEQERWSQRLSEVEAKICCSLAGRVSEMEFLGEAHTGASGDMRTVRARLLGLAEEGYFGSLMYKAEPSDEMVKEMDEMVERSAEKVRQVLREHAGKVEALVEALLDREELDEEEVAAILGDRPPRS
jgi:hypothetical protein